jgi:alcohol dehydrogenase class IV
LLINYQIQQRVKIVYGIGAVAQLGELLVESGYKKPMIVYDKGVYETGVISKIISILKDKGISCVQYDEVRPDPPIHTINKGIKICKEEKCDVLIGVGGGSSIDTAKGINVLRFNEPPIARFANPQEPMNHAPGFIAIPTTAGTGSELSDGIILSDDETNLKHAILAAEGIAEYAIVDPELMVGMPPKLTASTGIDALAHAMEAYTTNLASPFSDPINEKNFEIILKYLPIAYKDGKNIEARAKMAVAASMGGWMLANVHVHVGHSIGHILGAKCHVPHGVACAYALPYAMEFVAPVCPEKIKRIIEVMGGKLTGSESPVELGTKVKTMLKEYMAKFGIETKDFKLQPDITIDYLAKEVEGELMQLFTPRKMSFEDAKAILTDIVNN